MNLFKCGQKNLDEWIASKHPCLEIGNTYSEEEIFRFCQWLGFQSVGKTSPNPMVSAVLCDSKLKILAYGFHEFFGGKHAEVNCIESFLNQSINLNSLESYKIFVSLEPCFHYGKTPPCVDLLLKYKLGEVCIAAMDPNPLVAGKSIEKLRAHDVKVRIEQKFFEQTKLINFVFLKYHTLKRPIVAIKYATSKNKFFATKSGKPYSFTGERSREFAHFLRTWFDVMLLGVQTIIEDRPILDTRRSKVQRRNPSVVVIDPKLRFLDEDWTLHPWLNVKREKVIFLVSDSLSNERRREFEVKSSSVSEILGCSLDLKTIPRSTIEIFSAQQIVDVVSSYGFQSILVEGGMKTASSFYQAGLVDMIFHFSSNHELSEEEFREWTLPSKLDEEIGKFTETLDLGEDKLYIELKDT